MTTKQRLSPSPQGDNTLIVIPTYNEMSTLPTILEEIWTHVPAAHVLIVDDSSPDGTGEWVDKRRAGEERLFVLHRPAKSGLATAYVDGMGWGIEHGYPFILQMDADGSHRPVDLPKLLSRMGGPDRPDLVIGSRWVRAGRSHQRMVSEACRPVQGRQLLCPFLSGDTRTRCDSRAAGAPFVLPVDAWHPGAREDDRLRLPGGDDRARALTGGDDCRGADHL